MMVMALTYNKEETWVSSMYEFLYIYIILGEQDKTYTYEGVML